MEREESAIFRLIKKQMDDAMDENRRIIVEAIYQPTGLEGLPRLPTPSQWKRFQLRWWYPLRNYVATVGKAIRGVELVEPQDFEDY